MVLHRGRGTGGRLEGIEAVTSNIDVFRSAAVLVREHGDDASLEAAQLADAMMEKGDVEGAAVWRRIVKAAKELQRAEPGPGAARRRAIMVKIPLTSCLERYHM